MKVKRIFFDSGDVLVYPKSGKWFYPVQYFDWLKKHNATHFSFRQKKNEKEAIKKLLAYSTVKNNIDEYEIFLEFYAMLFNKVWRKDNPELIQLCAKSKVYDNTEQLIYPDVEKCLQNLYEKFELSIISDAWPSLKQKYANLGISHYFSPFIISTLHGADKSGYKLFEKALDLVEEKPEECLFIDDRLDNLRRAAKLGMKCIQCSRYKKKQSLEFVVIENFELLEGIIQIL